MASCMLSVPHSWSMFWGQCSTPPCEGVFQTADTGNETRLSISISKAFPLTGEKCRRCALFGALFQHDTTYMLPRWVHFSGHCSHSQRLMGTTRSPAGSASTSSTDSRSLHAEVNVTGERSNSGDVLGAGFMVMDSTSELFLKKSLWRLQGFPVASSSKNGSFGWTPTAA